MNVSFSHRDRVGLKRVKKALPLAFRGKFSIWRICFSVKLKQGKKTWFVLLFSSFLCYFRFGSFNFRYWSCFCDSSLCSFRRNWDKSSELLACLYLANVDMHTWWILIKHKRSTITKTKKKSKWKKIKLIQRKRRYVWQRNWCNVSLMYCSSLQNIIQCSPLSCRVQTIWAGTMLKSDPFKGETLNYKMVATDDF